MKIIEPSAEVLTPFGPLTPEIGIKMLQFIERIARISHRSEDRQTDDSWRKFIEAVVIGHGDWSVVEHCSLTVLFRVDRGITHELVRHRLFSFTQESTRFVNYGKQTDLEFIRPSQLTGTNAGFLWRNAVGESERTYLDLLKDGVRPQEGRAVLPNCLAASIAVTGNLRSFRHLFLMRSSKETHPDFRRVVDPLLKTFQTNIPLLYDDIEPGLRQVDNLKKPR
jgi:thymidylate synthase (FAD)